MTAMGTPVLLPVNVGLPRNVPWQGRTVYTGIWKHPVDGPAMIRRLNIDGDGQGDTSGHGGEQRAVLVYQIQAGDRPLRVTKVVPETATASSVSPAAADGSLLPTARPGQYLTLRIPGAGQPAPVRGYSLSSAPDTGSYRISVKHEPHGTQPGTDIVLDM